MAKDTGQKFMEHTKYQYLEMSDQDKGIEQPPIELEYDKEHKLIDLPNPKDIELGNVKLIDAIEKRKSLRKYSDKPLTMEELSYLLWTSQGVKEVRTVPITRRTVPSAGSRHALETYLLINNVKGLKPGVYRFIATKHKLIEVNLKEDNADKITEACLKQKFIKTSAVTFIWIAVPYRMKWRYGERAYRYLHLDAGHVCQNLYLSAEGIDCGACAIAAYNDDSINEILGLDGKNKFVIYISTVGKK